MPELNEYEPKTDITKVNDDWLQVDNIHFENKEDLLGSQAQIQEELSKVSNRLAQEQSRAQAKLDVIKARLAILVATPAIT